MIFAVGCGTKARCEFRRCMVIDEQIPSTPPQDQFRDDVLPPYKAYMSDKGSEWKARAAGNAAAHFAEHVWVYYKYHQNEAIVGKTGKAENFVKYLAKEHCPELMIVWDVALASKHRFLKKKSRLVDGDTGTFDDRLVHSSSEALAVDSGCLWMPDVDRYFDDVIEKAVNFWIRWLPTAPTYS